MYTQTDWKTRNTEYTPDAHYFTRLIFPKFSSRLYCFQSHVKQQRKVIDKLVILKLGLTALTVIFCVRVPGVIGQNFPPLSFFPREKPGRPILSPSWIHIQPLLIRVWGKTGQAHSFPTLTSESINLVQKLGYLGGEKLGWPILSSPRLVKVSTLLCHEYSNNLCFLGGGEKPGPFFPHATTLCRWLSGWRKTWLVRYFPTLTSESINLTLSWICKPPWLFRGWGKTGPAQSFPTLTSESINLVQKLGYLGGEKLGQPILSPPRLVKVSTLPCHE